MCKKKKYVHEQVFPSEVYSLACILDPTPFAWTDLSPHIWLQKMALAQKQVEGKLMISHNELHGANDVEGHV